MNRHSQVKGKDKGVLRNAFSIFFFVSALIVIALGFFSARRLDSTNAAASHLGKRIDRRIDILETYIDKAMSGDHNEWMDLEDLPPDMVVYRYVNDSLQSWCNQFTVDNDDISRRLIIKRFSNLRYNLESPLLGVGDSWTFMNIGPKWYLTRQVTDDEDCKIIAGLEIRNTISGAGNGINPRLKVSERFIVSPISSTGGSPVMVSGTPMMKLIPLLSSSISLFTDSTPVWCAIALVIIGLYLYFGRRKTIGVMLLTSIAIIVVNGVFYLMGTSLHNAPLFSPTTYADGRIWYSLGAVLLINLTIFFLIVNIFVVRRDIIQYVYSRNVKFRQTVYALSLAALFVLTGLYIHSSFTSIILNSNIALELYKVESVSLHTLLVYASFLTLLTAMALIVQMFRPVHRSISGKKYNVFSRTGRLTFAFLSTVYLLTVTSILGFRREANRVEIWSNRMAVERNLGFEIQLRSVENAIANDPLISSLLSPGGDYRVVLNRITENYLNRISQDYDISMYMYKDSEVDPTVLSVFNERITRGSPIADNSRFLYSRTPTGRAQYTGVFIYYTPGSGVTRLLLGIESKADKEGQGYSAIRGNSGSGSVVLPVSYSYGKYLEGNLVSFKGEYPYPTVFSGKLKEVSGEAENGTIHVTIDNFVHFLSHVSGNEYIVISRPKHDISKYLVAGFIIALFAYAGICMPLLGMRKRKFAKNYFRTTIGLVLYVSLTTTLIVMSIISIVFVYKRNSANLMTSMMGKITTIQSLVDAGCRHFDSYEDFNSQEVTAALGDISEYTKSDITLYTTGGKVFKSTDPEIFERMILGSRTDQEAYKNIVYRHKRYYIHREHINDHTFYSMYAPCFNASGKMLAIICSPYTDSGIDFRTGAIFHAVFIITSFLLLLLLARFFVAKVVDNMFRPLTEMVYKMNSAQINGLEYIIYEREDEISSLVRAYNLMVHDLSESTKQMAQVERDKAWSEMARQVAHEIKNPLTPIKLQIQRIIRLKSKNSPQWQEKFDTIVPIILDSIDQLTDTANEFSTFAKLYSEEPVLINLDQIAKEEIALFDNKDNIDIQYFGLQDSIVYGPKPQLTRVFVNLLTNAIQAIEGSQAEQQDAGIVPSPGRINLSIRNSVKDDFYEIVFEDNGPGVKDENRNNLFVPNFTTKSSGTGLGLAICKNILERCGGDIVYSRSFSLQGACFTVRFPKYKPS